MYLDDRVVRLQLWDTAGQVLLPATCFSPLSFLSPAPSPSMYVYCTVFAYAMPHAHASSCYACILVCLPTQLLPAAPLVHVLFFFSPHLLTYAQILPNILLPHSKPLPSPPPLCCRCSYGITLRLLRTGAIQKSHTELYPRFVSSSHSIRCNQSRNL